MCGCGLKELALKVDYHLKNVSYPNVFCVCARAFVFVNFILAMIDDILFSAQTQMKGYRRKARSFFLRNLGEPFKKLAE